MLKQIRLGDRVYVNTPHHIDERKIGTVYASTGKGTKTRYAIAWELPLDDGNPHLGSYSAKDISQAR